MELIYMYIKQMNNGDISNQGINFSRDFNVSLENNKLTIEKLQNPLKTYYGDNIKNVTALVGKNGSGKTSILDAVGLSYRDREQMSGDSLFMLYTYEKDYFIEIHNPDAISDVKNLSFKDKADYTIAGFYLENDKGNYICSPLGIDKNGNKIKGDFPLRYHYNILDYKSSRINEDNTYISIQDRNHLLNREYINHISYVEKYSIICEMNQNQITNEIDGNIMDHIHIKVSSIKDISDVEDHNDILKSALKSFDQLLSKFSAFKLESGLYKLPVLDAIDNDVIELLSVFDGALMNIKSLENINNYYNISIDYLSEGMENVLDSLSGLATLYLYNEDEAILLLDEPDRAMHPELARKFISILITQLKTFRDISLQVILSTHSPFLISDLLPESVYYVEKNNIRCGDKTLAANIHTLLYDKFFMNYTIGELARLNIESVYQLLKKDHQLSNSEIDYCRELIKRIGNEVLRTSLEKMLSSKLPSEVDRLEYEIEELNKLIEEKKDLLGGLIND